MTLPPRNAPSFYLVDGQWVEAPRHPIGPSGTGRATLCRSNGEPVFDCPVVIHHDLPGSSPFIIKADSP